MNFLKDSALSSTPTAEWQDRLAARLCKNGSGDSAGTQQQSPSRALGGAPLPQRRRLDESSSAVDPISPNWNDMYTMEVSSGEFLICTCRDPFDSVFNVIQIRNTRMTHNARLHSDSYRWTRIKRCAESWLTLRFPHRVQVRYHGKACGLHLIFRNDRLDSRLDGGVW